MELLELLSRLGRVVRLGGFFVLGDPGAPAAHDSLRSQSVNLKEEVMTRYVENLCSNNGC